MQRDVAVVAQFAQWDSQPVRGSDLHDRVDGEINELALAHAGARQEFHREAHERVVVAAGGLQHLGRGAVVEETGQRFVQAGQVTGEHQHCGRLVGAGPFGESLEAGRGARRGG